MTIRQYYGPNNQTIVLRGDRFTGYPGTVLYSAEANVPKGMYHAFKYAQPYAQVTGVRGNEEVVISAKLDVHNIFDGESGTLLLDNDYHTITYRREEYLKRKPTFDPRVNPVAGMPIENLTVMNLWRADVDFYIAVVIDELAGSMSYYIDGHEEFITDYRESDCYQLSDQHKVPRLDCARVFTHGRTLVVSCQGDTFAGQPIEACDPDDYVITFPQGGLIDVARIA